MSARPTRPPPPKPKPGKIKVVRALYRYEAQNEDELTFDEGDTLYIINQEDSNWWKARCNGKQGLIPSNYVEDNTESIDNPLHEACKRGNLDFLRECLNNKVSVNGLDKAGSTPLHWAAHGGHIECVKALLDIHNCEINVQNKLGDTPLHAAAWKGHVEAARLLLEKGAYTDYKNKENKTPMELAKDPSTAALLQQATRPQPVTDDYGDDDDSD